MFEELFEGLAGPWGLAAVLLLALPSGRKLARRASKVVIKTGLQASDYAKKMLAEAKEEAGDIMAEVQSERKEHAKHAHS